MTVSERHEILDARPSALDGLPILISVSQTAKLLGISRSAAYRCVASRDLPTVHLGGRLYVLTAQLREMLETS